METTGRTAPLPHPRVVLVHDWLTGMRGGEKCLEVLCRRWPDARLLTLLHKRGSVSPAIERLRPRISCLGRLPAVHRYYRYLLPLMPAVVDRWRLPACDLVVSFSHCVAKGVRPPLRQGQPVPHVCYCFTPVRYAWHMRASYFATDRVRGLKARLVEAVLARLRDWDRRTAEHVSQFVAISRTVQQRIRDCYGRDSVVIHPPVDTAFYTPDSHPRGDHYLIVSAFAPYKKLDLAILACNRLRRTLLIIGTGQDEGRLRTLAGPTIHFLGWQPDEAIRDHLRRCRALLFPGEEDFGIVPVEAMACGAPVVCYGRGGATETVVPLGGPSPATGVWFPEQTPTALESALEQFEAHTGAFHPDSARRQALRFTAERFQEQFFRCLDQALVAPVPRAPLQAA